MGLDAEWTEFLTTVPETAPPREIEIMRRGFYFGAQTMLSLILDIEDDISTQEVMEVIDGLAGEIQAAVNATDQDRLLKQRRAKRPAKGS